ncbi:hypothetical protein [Kribbella sp. NPDC048915]|uniref:hypothetical protein n=1 Tax=Kribbella sp. NPDC048915 TaxID=3155148 RepID=UPI0033EACD48
MLTARSLWEAETYVSLEIAQRSADQGDAAQPAPPLEVGQNVTEGVDAWIYASPVGDITIPYSSERSATTAGAHFGLGRSQLIDAAEWVKVAQLYGERAIEDQVYFSGEPEAPQDPEYRQRRHHVELGWELAAEAIVQAMAFLPDASDRVPEAEIWSEFGRSILADDPQAVTRARLEEDLEYYRGVLKDFRELQGPSAG